MHRVANPCPSLLLLLSALAFAACDSGGSTEPELELSELGPETDGLDDGSSDDDGTPADLDLDAEEPDADAEEAEAETAEDADAPDDAADEEELPPVDCAAECERIAPIFEECLGGFFSAGPAAVRRTPRYLALRLDDWSPDGVDAVRGLAATSRVRENPRERVVLVEGADASTRDALAQLGRSLPLASTTDGQIVVVLPRVLVGLQPGARPSELAARAGARFGGLIGDDVAILDFADEFHGLRQAERLRGEPGVAWAEADGLRAYSLRNDPFYPEQWHLDSTGQEGALPSADIMAPQAWRVTEGSPDVVIGVYDDGVDFEHPDLADSIVGGFNLPTDLPQAIGAGCCSHGTAVAGVAAAAGYNGIGVRGVCPRCKLMPLYETFALMSDSGIAANLRSLVDAGVSVINCSWGPVDGSPSVVDEAPGGLPPVSLVIRTALDHAETAGRGGLGTVITWAAGNGNELCSDDGYAAYPTVLAVAAHDDQNRKSWYSDYGPEVDVSAPSSGGLGHGIVTTAATGGSTYGAFYTGEQGEHYTRGFGGTSSAAPTAAGLAGLVISANPTLTAAQVRDVIRFSADPIDPLNGRYDENGHSVFYGYGAINAYRAVLMALGEGCESTRPDPCNGVDDNCDGQIDPGCPRLADCAPCTRDAECEEGRVCARLAGDAGEFCIARCEHESCADGTSCVGGFCLPEGERCAACLDAELCNGVDDDCNGEVDEAGCTASQNGTCDYDAQCPGESICSSGYCMAACAGPQDCGGDDCLPATLRYGEVADGLSLCDTGVGAMCIGYVCNAGKSEKKLRRFFDCIDNWQGDCGLAIGCLLNFMM